MKHKKINVKDKKDAKTGKTSKKKVDGLSGPLFNQKGEKVKNIKLPDEIFGLKPNSQLVALAVRVYLANQKQETASTKTRAEVRGGGRKPWRQKGTGRARAGSIRAAGRIGGGVVFGPKPVEKTHYLPKKMKLKALAVALSDKVRDEGIFLLDKLAFKEPKTKKASDIVDKIAKTKKKTLVILEEPKIETIKSFKNLEDTTTTQAVDLNALDVVKFPSLIITLEALEKLKDRFGDKHE